MSSTTMNTYIIKYRFNGYNFYEVVQAENEEQAWNYFLWIIDDWNNDRHCISIKVVNNDDNNTIPSYFCPIGWTKPESVEAARRRCLIAMLSMHGIDIMKSGWSPKLDKIMIDAGYIKDETYDEEWDEYDVFYHKDNGCPLRVVRQDDKNNS